MMVLTSRLRQTVLVSALLFASTGALADGPQVVGAMGDSISAAANARRLGDNREMSWATGSSTQVNSHFRRLQAENAAVTAFNEAVSGSKAADLDAQITKLLPRNPDYVTVTIGANDICNWSADYQQSLADFTTTMHAAVTRLIAARPQIKVLLTPIPDMMNLYQLGVQRSSCQTRWDLFNVCSPLLNSSRSDAERSAFMERWAAANAVFGDIAAEFPANVLFSDLLAHATFEDRHVSGIDCFHPSIEGQNLLADKTWLLYLEAR